jgi:hypothetical protein
MGKSDNLELWIAQRFGSPDGHPPERISTHPCFRAYLHCFNAGEYYQAHDVLEHLWLRTPPGTVEHRHFKSLIQYAGAYVHLRHHRSAPAHRIHGRRLYPAAKLFRLAAAGWEGLPAVYHGFPVALARQRALRLAAELQLGAYAYNPWSPRKLPQLIVLPGS